MVHSMPISHSFSRTYFQHCSAFINESITRRTHFSSSPKTPTMMTTRMWKSKKRRELIFSSFFCTFSLAFFSPFAHIGPRYRRPKVKKDKDDEKRPRTAFSNEQLNRLKVSELVRKWDDNDKSKRTEVNEKYFKELISSIIFRSFFYSITQKEFNENRYLTEKRRQHLSAELGLNEAQIKIW